MGNSATGEGLSLRVVSISHVARHVAGCLPLRPRLLSIRGGRIIDIITIVVVVVGVGWSGMFVGIDLHGMLVCHDLYSSLEIVSLLPGRCAPLQPRPLLGRHQRCLFRYHGGFRGGAGGGFPRSWGHVRRGAVCMAERA